MPTTDAAVALVNSIQGGDPITEAAKWVASILLLIGVGTYPFLMFLNKRVRDRNENNLDTAMSEAGSSLYTQLIKQVDEYRKIADKAYREREELTGRVAALELQLALHNNDTELVAKLTIRLEAKDREIATLIQQFTDERSRFLDVLSEKEEAINTRDSRISLLEKSVHDLQLRLVRDETMQIFMNRNCVLAQTKIKEYGKGQPGERYCHTDGTCTATLPSSKPPAE